LFKFCSFDKCTESKHVRKLSYSFIALEADVLRDGFQCDAWSLRSGPLGNGPGIQVGRPTRLFWKLHPSINLSAWKEFSNVCQTDQTLGRIDGRWVINIKWDSCLHVGALNSSRVMWSWRSSDGLHAPPSSFFTHKVIKQRYLLFFSTHFLFHSRRAEDLYRINAFM
jgi:hypothetical protein